MSRISVLFYTVIAIGFSSAAMEIYLIHHIATTGQLGMAQSFIALASGSAAFGAFKLIKQAWSNHFITRAIIDSEDLRKYYSQRLQIVLPSESPSHPAVTSISRRLITQYLVLLESLLKKRLGDFHYELSVFCNKVEPEIVAYYDSSGNCNSRTENARKSNPQFYIENKYKVIELLKSPSAESIALADTFDPEASYSFVSKEQKKNIKSTLLHCVDLQWPAVLVITCREKNAFSNSSDFKDAFLSVYNAIATDLNLGLIFKP